MFYKRAKVHPANVEVCSNKPYPKKFLNIEKLDLEGAQDLIEFPLPPPPTGTKQANRQLPGAFRVVQGEIHDGEGKPKTIRKLIYHLLDELDYKLKRDFSFPTSVTLGWCPKKLLYCVKRDDYGEALQSVQKTLDKIKKLKGAPSEKENWLKSSTRGY